jgi:di/tricarboxylate transporter
MTTEMLIVLAVILLAIILFATEKIPVDLTAIIVMGVLLLSGIISIEEGISGFSNVATITVGAMFVVSAALKKTGAVSYLGVISSRIFKSNFWLGLIGTMLTVGIVSAFVNNTPVVAVFIPILMSVSLDNKIPLSKLLMPISFASMFGGVCTLIGTSTNILVSSIAVQHDLPPLGMFEFSSLGITFFAAGIIYMIFIGVRLIPKRGEGDLTEKYRMDDYLTDIVLLPEAKSVDMKLPDSPLVKELDIDILEVIRNGHRLLSPLAQIVLKAEDVLRVRSDIKQIQKLKDRMGIKFVADHKLHEEDFKTEELLLVEAIVAPNSSLIGKTIKTSRFRNIYRANALAIRHRGQLYNTGFSDTPLAAGDAILLEVRQEDHEEIKNDTSFVIVSELDIPKLRKSRIIPALLIVLGIILTATFNVLPIVISALIGCILLVISKTITLEEAYRAVDWSVIFLLGGILSLGIALDKTGAALLISDKLIELLGSYGPTAVVAALFLLTLVLTSIMSNNATAVLLAPIAIAAAATMGVNPKPFLMAVAFAASSSFMTPVGYQTNTMIYGVGQYRFADFLKVGTPLSIIFWILAIILIPVFFPF